MQGKLIQSSFSVVFPRQSQIRRRANEFEDRLKGRYFQPQIIPVPDDMDPEVPRMVFDSANGFSQVIISQVSIILSAVYSPDWQTDVARGQAYFLERAGLIFDLIDLLENTQPYFCGLTNRAHFATNDGERATLERIASLLLSEPLGSDTFDLEIKTTTVKDQRFFDNVTLRNFRAWPATTLQGVARLPRTSAVENGIELLCDFNDRYAFNEDQTYFTDRTVMTEVVQNGFEGTIRTLDRLRR